MLGPAGVLRSRQKRLPPPHTRPRTTGPLRNKHRIPNGTSGDLTLLTMLGVANHNWTPSLPTHNGQRHNPSQSQPCIHCIEATTTTQAVQAYMSLSTLQSPPRNDNGTAGRIKPAMIACLCITRCPTLRGAHNAKRILTGLRSGPKAMVQWNGKPCVQESLT